VNPITMNQSWSPGLEIRLEKWVAPKRTTVRFNLLKSSVISLIFLSLFESH